MNIRTLIIPAVLVLAACSPEESTDAMLANMEDAAPGATLGRSNACNDQKQEIVNQFGVDYRYQAEIQYRQESQTQVIDGIEFTRTQNIEDGIKEYFHYFSRSYVFDARSGNCQWGPIN